MKLPLPFQSVDAPIASRGKRLRYRFAVFVASGKADVLALPASLHLGQWLGLVMLGVIAWLLYRTVVKQAEASPR